MVRKAGKVRNHAPIRPPEKRNHLAEIILRGSALRVTSVPFGILHLADSIKAARVTLVRSASFSMLTLLLPARGDPSPNSQNRGKRNQKIPVVFVADRL